MSIAFDSDFGIQKQDIKQLVVELGMPISKAVLGKLIFTLF
ncbi:hypothetical protein [Borrelia persica]|nr:hypothetical protein [Borrelia persica]